MVGVGGQRISEYVLENEVVTTMWLLKIIWDNSQSFYREEGNGCLTFTWNGERLTVEVLERGKEEFSLVEVEVMSSYQVEMSSDKLRPLQWEQSRRQKVDTRYRPEGWWHDSNEIDMESCRKHFNQPPKDFKTKKKRKWKSEQKHQTCVKNQI